ncbi:hypothetical protein EDB89DRAFT_1911749 [Lactarius sanguifluus]|nr:hypothetical protein EDB89DRAFT_1911749 [Lactarius sanguifluus]
MCILTLQVSTGIWGGRGRKARTDLVEREPNCLPSAPRLRTSTSTSQLRHPAGSVRIKHEQYGGELTRHVGSDAADETSCMVTEVASYASNESLGTETIVRLREAGLTGELGGTDQWPGRQAKWRR